MNKIKIFVDCHIFDDSFQGTRTYISEIYKILIKDEINFHFFLASKDSESLKNVFGEQDNVTYITYKSSNKFFRLLFDIPRIIKRNNIDFAHFQYIVPPIKYCKYILTIHDVLFLDFPKYFPLSYRLKNRLLFQISAKISDHHLTVSNYSKERIEKHFKINNILITPNAVENKYFELFNKREVEENVFNTFNIKNYFLYVSRREPRKNHLTLLKVFVEYKYYEKYQLIFVGKLDIIDENYEDYYKSLNDNIKSRIIILDKVNDGELLLLTRGAKVSIYPSFAEGFGIPPLESVACGIPTICSNKTAMGEFEFMSPFLFNPYSVKNLNQKLILALSEYQEFNFKENSKKIYSWEKSSFVIQNLIKNHKK